GGGGTQYGVTLPTGLVFGVTVSDKVKIALNLDVPFFVTFGDYGTPTIPILFGGGVEYFLDRSTALTFTLRTWPMIFRKYGTDCTFEALLGVGYRWGGGPPGPGPAAGGSGMPPLVARPESAPGAAL